MDHLVKLALVLVHNCLCFLVDIFQLGKIGKYSLLENEGFSCRKKLFSFFGKEINNAYRSRLKALLNALEYSIRTENKLNDLFHHVDPTREDLEG